MTARPPTAVRRASVLLVDFHADTLDLYTDYLRFRGLTVVATTRAAEALSLAARLQPDAVCVAYRLQGVDGADVAARLKAGRHTTSIPVLLLMSFIDEPHLRRARESGADAVLLKPLLPETLFAEIARLLPSAP